VYIAKKPFIKISLYKDLQIFELNEIEWDIIRETMSVLKVNNKLLVIFIKTNQINGEKECNFSDTGKWELLHRFKRGAKCSCIGIMEEKSSEEENEGRSEGRSEGRNEGRSQIPIGTEERERRDEQVRWVREEILEEIGRQRRGRSLERGGGIERLRERGGSLESEGRRIGRRGNEVERFEGGGYEESSSRLKGKQKVGESSTRNGKTKSVLYICDNYYYSHVQFNVNNFNIYKLNLVKSLAT